MVLHVLPHARTQYENLFELEDGDILNLVIKAWAFALLYVLWLRHEQWLNSLQGKTICKFKTQSFVYSFIVPEVIVVIMIAGTHWAPIRR